MRVIHCLVIRSGFEPETHSLEGCCSIQLSYQTLVGIGLRERNAPCAFGSSPFLLLKCVVFKVLTHKTTHVGTQNSAYKGNLGAKVLLFWELCK